MSEIVLKIGDGGGFEDGDVLTAYTALDTSWKHVQHLAHPRKSRTVRGYIPKDSPTYTMLRQSSLYLNQRVSSTELMVTDLLSHQSTLYGPGSININLFLRRRFSNRFDNGAAKLPIFGEEGKEVWFSGYRPPNNGRANRCWEAIEEQLGKDRSSRRYEYFPHGRLDLRSHLVVISARFTENQKRDFRERGQSRKRGRKVEWRDILSDLGETEARVLNRSEMVGSEESENGEVYYRPKAIARAMRLNRITRKR